MKRGDLVRCIWQPGAAGVRAESVIPMRHIIKDKLGLIICVKKHRSLIMFPQFNGYTHWLSYSAFEIINEAG